MPHKVAFIDLETTGVNPEECGVIQISCSIDIDNNPVGEFNELVRPFPDDIIYDDALDKSNTFFADLYDLPDPDIIYHDFCEWLGSFIDKYNKKDKLIVVAYKADFDNQFLRQFFKKNKDDFFGSWFWHPWIDCMNLAAYFYQDERHHFENFKMETVCRYMNIPFDPSILHDASYDRELCRQIYYKLTT